METAAGLLGIVLMGSGIIFWIVWSLVNGLIAEEKGRSFVRIFFFSFFLSPLLGYLYILAVPFKELTSTQGNTEKPIKNITDWRSMVR